MKIILLGHGEETKQSFSFKNNNTNRITLHSFTKANMYLRTIQAALFIIDIVGGENKKYITYDNKSTVGGHVIADRILHPLEDELRTAFEHVCHLNQTDEITMGENDQFSFYSYEQNNILLFSPHNDVQLSIILEAINNTYPNQDVDVYWMACRA